MACISSGSRSSPSSDAEALGASYSPLELFSVCRFDWIQGLHKRASIIVKQRTLYRSTITRFNNNYPIHKILRITYAVICPQM